MSSTHKDIKNVNHTYDMGVGENEMETIELYCKLSEKIPSNQLLLRESMKKHTSFHIGGLADILMLPSKSEEIQYAIGLCKQYHYPYMVMGNGSNLLVRDKGIRGLVIKIADRFKNIKVEGTMICAQAGVVLSSLSKVALKEKLSGLEFANGIPGTLGGAVSMNAGAYNGETKDIIKKVTILDENEIIRELNLIDLHFGYRSSIIQQQPYTVLKAEIELKKDDYRNIQATMDDLTHRRKEKQPLQYPSAGSTFKRAEGYYTGKLIQDAGLKGMRVGDAQVSELHCGFIINLGNASACDVITLIDKIKEKVKMDSGVDLHPEVKIVGDE